MSDESENTLHPCGRSPAAAVINYHPATSRAPPTTSEWMTPYETLAYLAYILPAPIYAANPWLLDPEYQDWLHDLKHSEH
ncbi:MULTISPECIES: hypothetical protein [Lysobacter]|uniref:hypothetical protein n=1 Tax=Lysobacter TaxID=68 RepID=UPI001F32A768|nr:MULTISPECIES: hypothetical protein [Lysobacter]UJB19208.1 hypothetical protein L1A79_23335 [Lysobacter capsici]UJQ27067.1 hypothetical protein L2D09_16550 [Lysobacter gummosus]